MKPIGPPGRGGRFGGKDEPEQKKSKHWWVFPAVAAGLTLLWIVLSLPTKEDDQGEPGEDMTYVTKRAGWPFHFARWSVANDTGNTTYSTFSLSMLLIDLVFLAAPITAAWFITRHLKPPEEKPSTRTKGGRGTTPPRGPPGTARGSGGRS